MFLAWITPASRFFAWPDACLRERGRPKLRELASGSQPKGKWLVCENSGGASFGLSGTVFVPEIGIFVDEFLHQANAITVVENDNLDASPPKEFFIPAEILIFTYDHTRDAELYDCA
jgi:hypothetical protein